MNPDPRHIKEPEPAQAPAERKTGCTIILKSGRSYTLEGISISEVKFRRRNGLDLPLKRPNGQKEVIDCSQIANIVPLISSSTPS